MSNSPSQATSEIPKSKTTSTTITPSSTPTPIESVQGQSVSYNAPKAFTRLVDYFDEESKNFEDETLAVEETQVEGEGDIEQVKEDDIKQVEVDVGVDPVI